MKFLAILAIFARCLFAQTLPTLSIAQLGTGAAYPGATLNFALNLSGSTGLNLATIGLTNWPGGSNFQAGTASVTAQKTLQCDSTTGACLMAGVTLSTPPVVSNNVYPDGQVLTFSYTVPDSAQIGSTIALAVPSPVYAVDASSNTIALPTTGLSLPVVINPACISRLISEASAFLAAPSQPLLIQFETTLASIVAGTCKLP